MTIRALAFTFLLFIPLLSFATIFPELIVPPTTDPSLQILGTVLALPERTVHHLKLDSNNNLIRNMLMTAYILNDDSGKPLNMIIVVKKIKQTTVFHHPPIFEETKIYAIGPAEPRLPMVYFDDLHSENSVRDTRDGMAIDYLAFSTELSGNGDIRDYRGTVNVALEEDANGALTGNIKVFHEVDLSAE